MSLMYGADGLPSMLDQSWFSIRMRNTVWMGQAPAQVPGRVVVVVALVFVVVVVGAWEVVAVLGVGGGGVVVVGGPGGVVVVVVGGPVGVGGGVGGGGGGGGGGPGGGGGGGGGDMAGGCVALFRPTPAAWAALGGPAAVAAITLLARGDVQFAVSAYQRGGGEVFLKRYLADNRGARHDRA